MRIAELEPQFLNYGNLEACNVNFYTHTTFAICKSVQRFSHNQTLQKNFGCKKALQNTLRRSPDKMSDSFSQKY